MLAQITLLSFLIFAVTYPLCFWLSCKDPIKNNFLRFHLGCPLVIAGLSVMGLWSFSVLGGTLKSMSVLWFLAFFVMTAFYWNKEKVPPLAVTLVSLWGLGLFSLVYVQLTGGKLIEVAVCVLAGMIVAAAFYAMNLGHFYLNVHGLKIHHLRNAVIAFAVLLALRLLWNIFYIYTGKVLWMGEQTSLLRFMSGMDGFFLWVAVFFGTVFPLAASYFAFGTLKLKNTQATTGILYVLLSAVLLGDLAYKYYLIKYSIAL